MASRFPCAHPSPLYKVRPLSEHLWASGDEDGSVRLWDHRASGGGGPVMDLKPFDDFVSDFHADDECRTLVASSGEGQSVLFHHSFSFIHYFK